MKKFLLALMVVTLLAGMSLPALACEPEPPPPICPGPVESEVPVYMTIAPWTKVEFNNDFDFKTVGFCNWGEQSYRLYWIDSSIFMETTGAGADMALLPGGSDATWKTLVNLGANNPILNVHVNNGQEGINPQLIITTNTEVNATLSFERVQWPETLPTFIAIWNFGQGGGYLGYFGQNVEIVGGGNVSNFAKIDGIPAAKRSVYHLDAGILFGEEFWQYKADDYTAKILCTIEY